MFSIIPNLHSWMILGFHSKVCKRSKGSNNASQSLVITSLNANEEGCLFKAECEVKKRVLKITADSRVLEFVLHSVTVTKLGKGMFKQHT